ncbi:MULTISPECIES: hypothetical protein [Olivibacter]|jgi:hypothetical protein|uniref:Uncharacterized protein n=1 Tax=Olivibacter oleidegradans TaxID=760123 RepID=A0ABV6HDP6_9SPHI|nr:MULTISPECIES: hypothetical protein [Olivibacter]MDM8177832.1 hypothetical protein [Olivibacter sp. 47]QEK99529.1 hypothetical protein FKG96_01515 [Olivibacter sp. LS-1]
MQNEQVIVDSSFTAMINAPIEKINIPEWCFTLPEHEYQACSPAHVTSGVTTSPDGKRMSVNVEVLGGSLMVQHYIEKVSKPSHLILESVSDIFTPSGHINILVHWEMSVKKIDDNTCEFTNRVISKPTEEFIKSIEKQGIPFELFKSQRQPVSIYHNQSETPLFAKSIERYAFRNN